MVALFVYVHTHLLVRQHRLRSRHEAGQATAEYALVLLGAATVALMLVAWATKTGKVGRLLDTVLDSVAGKIR